MLVSEANMQRSKGREGSSGRYRDCWGVVPDPEDRKNEAMGDGWEQIKMRLHRISILTLTRSSGVPAVGGGIWPHNVKARRLKKLLWAGTVGTVLSS